MSGVRGARLGLHTLLTGASQVAGSVLTLLVAPLLVTRLGAAGYGLVGLSVALQQAFAFLDLGLSVSAAREFARGRVGAPGAPRAEALLRTLEGVYVGTALVIVACAAAWAAWFAGDATGGGGLPPAQVRAALLLVAVMVGVRWPVALYTAVLRGGERHTLLAALTLAGAVLRTLGGLAVVWWMADPLLAYFRWQCVVAGAEACAFAWLAWGRTGGATAWRGARFEAAVLRVIWRGTLAVFVASAMATVLKQADRFVLAHALTLREVGYYSLAANLGAIVLLAVGPVLTVASPRLAALHAEGRAAEERALFLGASELVACVASPIAWALVIEGPRLLAAWTGDPAVAAAAGTTLRVLGLAGLLNAAMQVPYLLQVAAGRTGIAAVTNTVGALLATPLMWLLVPRLGVLGAGVGWLAFNVGYVAVVPAVLSRRVIPGAWREWAVRHVTAPALLGGACMLAGSLAATPVPGRLRPMTACLLGGLCYAGTLAVLGRRGAMLRHARAAFGPRRAPAEAPGALIRGVQPG